MRVRRFRVIDGKVQEVTAPAPARSTGNGPAYSVGNPLPSVAASCHRDQVEEYREEARKHGLTGLEYDNNGNAFFTDRGDAGRRGWMKLTGRHDNDGGYGDG